MDRPWLKQLIAGGVAGCCAKTVIAPLDRIKILLQAQHPYYHNFRIFQALVEVSKREGVPALWKGNSIMMFRIFPYAATQFFAFEHFKNIYKGMFGDHRHINRLMAGSSAGITAVLCTYPLDFVRTRVTYQITGEHKYTSIPHAIIHMFKNEGGIRSFYSGISATLMGMVPYAGIAFYTFETLKTSGLEMFPAVVGRKDPNNPDNIIISKWSSLLFGGLAGAISQTVSFPLDVARRRMQLAQVLPDTHKYKTVWSTIRTVYHANGIRKGLYRGLSINYIRVVPQQAIAFTVYEYMKVFLNIEQDKTVKVHVEEINELEPKNGK